MPSRKVVKRKSIFVQVPAYRDYELPKTIENVVSSSSGETLISFGVHNCVLFPREVTVKIEQPQWVKIHYAESIAPTNIGLQRARNLANQFYDGEDYYLQIDSHMRLIKNWDKILIEDLSIIEQYGVQKPLMTMYPSDYGYDDDGKEVNMHNTNYFTEISFKENKAQFEETLIPSQTAVMARKNCLFTPSVSGGFIFTTGEFSLVTPNPKIAFWGEEPLIAARAFTHGFTLVIPPTSVASHLYASQQPFAKMRRHHAWADFPQEWASIQEESMNEYTKIFTERVVGEYAFGPKRTLAEYEEFSGLNFATREITPIF